MFWRVLYYSLHVPTPYIYHYKLPENIKPFVARVSIITEKRTNSRSDY